MNPTCDVFFCLCNDAPCGCIPDSLDDWNLSLPTTKSYPCYYCKQEFITDTLRGHHLKEFHPNSLPYRCEKCDHRFRFKSRLEAHIISHQKDRNYTCSICNRKYKHPQTLKQHVSLHNQTKKYICSVPNCTKKYKHEKSLIRHKKYHDSDQFWSCITSGCDRKFKYKQGLIKHMKTHDTL